MPALAREAADRMGALLLTGKGPLQPRRLSIKAMTERPAHEGGAEGTRTPDPHTARVAWRHSQGSVAVRLRGSDPRVVVGGLPCTTRNAAVWPPSWHHAKAA
jgi:hypothetical protein